jgi:hypothetical protein
LVSADGPTWQKYVRNILSRIEERLHTMHTRFLVGKPEGKRQLGRLRRMWEDKIKIDLREIE